MKQGRGFVKCNNEDQVLSVLTHLSFEIKDKNDLYSDHLDGQRLTLKRYVEINAGDTMNPLFVSMPANSDVKCMSIPYESWLQTVKDKLAAQLTYVQCSSIEEVNYVLYKCTGKKTAMKWPTNQKHLFVGLGGEYKIRTFTPTITVNITGYQEWLKKNDYSKDVLVYVTNNQQLDEVILREYGIEKYSNKSIAGVPNAGAYVHLEHGVTAENYASMQTSKHMHIVVPDHLSSLKIVGYAIWKHDVEQKLLPKSETLTFMNSMNLDEKYAFVGSILGDLTGEITSLVNKMPAEFNGIEIRQFIADYFMKNYVDAKILNGERRKEYDRFFIING